MKSIILRWYSRTFIHKALRTALVAYSTWALIMVGIITAAPDVIFVLWERDTDPKVWPVLIYITVILGLIGRFHNQNKTHKWRRRGIIAVIIFMGVGFASVANAQQPYQTEFEELSYEFKTKWEGSNKQGDLHVSYLDIVDVCTVCYGHTKTAVCPGQTKTEDECKALLIMEMRQYQRGFHSYLTLPTLTFRLTAERDTAFTSLCYNVGVRGCGRSTAVRRLNQGRIKGACDALTWWNKAGGRVVRGLVRRRAEERELCLRGL